MLRSLLLYSIFIIGLLGFSPYITPAFAEDDVGDGTEEQAAVEEEDGEELEDQDEGEEEEVEEEEETEEEE